MTHASAFTLICIALLFVAFGLVMLYSTSGPYAEQRFGDGDHYLKRQCMWITLGLVALIVAMRVDVHALRRISPLLLLAAIAMLVLTLIPGIGVKVNGARRWLGAGPFRFQPSEAAKLALVLFLAHRLSWDQRRIRTFFRGFLVPIVATGVVVGLVFREPDYGTSALIAAVAMTMMFAAGVRLIYLLPTMFAGASGFAVAIARDPERMGRMLAFLDLEAHGQDAGYQVKQAILAFGSGGVSGLGLAQSRQKMFYLPEAHTDFIFPIIGEELGLWATLAVVALFLLFFIAAVILSFRSGDLYMGLLGFGVATLIGLQAIINMGVVTGLLPTKGLPLPFISFGGSNLMVNLAAVGILINIYRHVCGEIGDGVPVGLTDRTPAL